MPKANPNGNDSSSTAFQPTVHLVLQGKGGVGKSVIASWLAEYLIKRGQPVCCIDGDPVNRSLGQYKAIPVDKLELVDASESSNGAATTLWWTDSPKKKWYS